MIFRKKEQIQYLELETLQSECIYDNGRRADVTFGISVKGEETKYTVKYSLVKTSSGWKILWGCC